MVRGEKVRGEKVRALAVLVGLMACGSLFAFQPIPKESAKALKTTRTKPFSSGVVFVNGKYIEPPYVVERWGTGIRINKIPVTGQIVDWNEFLKTQPNVKVEKRETEPAPVPVTAPAQSASSVSDETSSLDDLFDDDPKPTKTATAPRAVAAVPAAPKPAKPAVTYVLSGKFSHNDDSRALLKRIDANRTEIDRALRSGGFICFGNSYSMVQGDRRTLMELMETLPELQQRSSDEQSFYSSVRAARLVYLNEVLCQDLFRNRMDYRKLKERREKLKSDEKWDKILDDVSDPIF